MNNSIITSLLNQCLQLVNDNNTELIVDNLYYILDLLKTNEMIIDENDECTDDLADDNTSIISSDDSDASFTEEQLSYIKDQDHYNYLLRYSLKPTFNHQYCKK